MEGHEVQAEDIRWRLWREDRCWSLEVGGVTVRLLAERCCGRGRPMPLGFDSGFFAFRASRRAGLGGVLGAVIAEKRRSGLVEQLLNFPAIV